MKNKILTLSLASAILYSGIRAVNLHEHAIEVKYLFETYQNDIEAYGGGSFSFNQDFRHFFTTTSHTAATSNLELTINHTIIASPSSSITGRFRVTPMRRSQGGTWARVDSQSRIVTSRYAWNTTWMSWTTMQLGGPGDFRFIIETDGLLEFTTSMFRVNGVVTGR